MIEIRKIILGLLSASFHSVRRLFILAYVIADNASDEEAGTKKIESIFFQEERLKIITYWLMEKIFMTNH